MELHSALVARRSGFKGAIYSYGWEKAWASHNKCTIIDHIGWTQMDTNSTLVD